MFIQVSTREKCSPPLSTYVVLSQAVFAQPSESHFQPSPDHNKFRESWCVGVDFKITISATEDGPSGYLFLCSANDLQGRVVITQMAGLCTEAATHLGFPSIQLGMEIEGQYWGPTYTRDCVKSQVKSNPVQCKVAPHISRV
jgi:hypothetical protein